MSLQVTENFTYRHIPDTRRTLVGNKIVNHSLPVTEIFTYRHISNTKRTLVGN